MFKYQFDIPIEVKCGKIGRLEINVSYTNIWNQPAIAKIEDLLILLGPFEEKKYDPKRIEELNSAHKRKELLETEKIERAQIFGEQLLQNKKIHLFSCNYLCFLQIQKKKVIWSSYKTV